MTLRLRLSENSEKQRQDFAFQEINEEFESQRFQLHQASRWADQAQRDKINLYGELELRNRLFQERQPKNCQEIEELRRICCEETDRARQARIDELSMQQQRNPATVSQMKAQIRDFQNKVKSNSLRFRVSGLCRAAFLDCREIRRIVLVLWETSLNDHLLMRDYLLFPSTIQRIWHLHLRI